MEEDQEECEQKEKRFRRKNKQSNKKLLNAVPWLLIDRC